MTSAFWKRGLFATLALLAAVFVSGCADMASGVTKGVLDKVLEDKPPYLIASISVADDVNPDHMGRPSPVVIRVYELKTLSVFQNADFFSLYEEDNTILQEDMTAREEIELVPGEVRNFERELKPETRYVAVLVAFRNLDEARWRGAIATPPDEKTRVAVQIDKLSVSVQAAEKSGWF